MNDGHAGSLEIAMNRNLAMDVDRVGDDDSHPFWDAHIRVITIHSITQQSWAIYNRHAIV